MRLILVFLIGFWSSAAVAQTGSLSGVVSHEGSALEFVSVGLRNSTLGTATDVNGRYTLTNIPYGTYEVMVSMVGYQAIYKSVRVSGDHTLDFEMKESATALDEVVVSGTMQEISKLESAVPVEVYSPQFFKANPTPSVFESLQNVNGVRPQLNCNVCNTGDIHINGLEGPYTMVLIDGMPIVSGLSTVYGLTGIPQSLIERVEIVKGAASTLYGSEALGGLINIITKKPDNAPLVTVDAFATGWAEVNADVGVKLDVGRAQSLVGVNYFNYQNPIDNNNDGFTDITLQDRFSVFNKWNFKRADGRVFSLAGRYVYEDRWGGEMNWAPRYRGGDQVYGESIYTKRWESFGVYQLPVQERINFQFSINGHDQDSYYGTTQYDATQYVGFGQFTWNKSLLTNQELLVGLAYRYTYYDDNTTATFDEQNQQNHPSSIHLPGVFLQDDIRLNDQHKILLGVRYDYNSLHGNIFSPRLNYKWNSPDKHNIFRMSIGNGYRVANVFTEDHAALTGARSVVFDEELKPEKSWNTNANFVKKIYTAGNAFIGIDASLFYTFFNNRIVPDYETNTNEIRYGNLEGSAVSQGASLNLDIAWSSGLSMLAGATVMDVTIKENGTKTRQILTERFSGVWNIGYTFVGSDITIDYTGNLYGPMRLPLLSEFDNRPAYSPWWSLQNIQVTKTFASGIEVYGGVKNLLNYTPPANSIARSHDPFDEQVQFDADGQAMRTAENPYALTFDPSYVFAPNQGIRGFLGVRYTLR